MRSCALWGLTNKTPRHINNIIYRLGRFAYVQGEFPQIGSRRLQLGLQEGEEKDTEAIEEIKKIFENPRRSTPREGKLQRIRRFKLIRED